MPDRSRRRRRKLPQPDPRPQHDLDLVRRVVAGDAAARTCFGERLGIVPLLLARLERELGTGLTPTELEDLQQDVIVVVWRKLAQFEGRSSLNTWIYQICHLELLTARRQRRRYLGRHDATANPDAAPGPSERDPARFQGLYAGLARLPAEECQIVRRKHYDAWTFEQIARECRMSPSQIKTRYYRAMTRLREWLHDRDEPGAAH